MRLSSAILTVPILVIASASLLSGCTRFSYDLDEMSFSACIGSIITVQSAHQPHERLDRRDQHGCHDSDAPY